VALAGIARPAWPGDLAGASLPGSGPGDPALHEDGARRQVACFPGIDADAPGNGDT
jgi:hypothetical protein